MSKSGKTLRTIAIILMGLTSVFTILGAVGMVCISWNADKFGKAFEMYVPFLPIYQNLVYVKIIAGIAGVVATYALIRGDRWAYWGSVIILVIGLVSAAIQMYYSSTLKGVGFFQTPPTSMRFYITLITLVFFLILRIGGIRSMVDFTAPWGKSGSKPTAGGLAAFVGGIAVLTVPLWAGASHSPDGVNLVYTFAVPLMSFGAFLTLLGAGCLALATLGVSFRHVADSMRRLALSLVLPAK
jgi:hypothetical protein